MSSKRQRKYIEGNQNSSPILKTKSNFIHLIGNYYLGSIYTTSSACKFFRQMQRDFFLLLKRFDSQRIQINSEDFDIQAAKVRGST